MKDLRVLIVDDEEPARRRLCDLVQQTPGATVLGMCEGGRQAIGAIVEDSPDLVFLDIRMPEVSGFDVLEAVGADRMPAVIFVTAYDEYAVGAFDHAAIDYLLKPFDDERFATAFARAREIHSQHQHNRQHLRLMELLSHGLGSPANKSSGEEMGRGYARRVAVREGDVVRLIEIESLDYIQAQGPYAELYVGDECILHRERMHVLESRLDPSEFCRIHRSTIVRLHALVALEIDNSGDHLAKLRSGAALRVSRTRLATLQERLALL